MWLRTQKRIMNVDISDCGIQGEVPTWFWNLSSQSRLLNLSHNHFVGEVPTISTPSLTNQIGGFWAIYLSSNNFNGPIPLISTNVTELDLSNNSFSKAKNGSYKLRILNLGGNDLSEEIPDCWMNWLELKVLILWDNNLIGCLPFSMEMQTIHFVGIIPKCIGNFSAMVKVKDEVRDDLELRYSFYVGVLIESAMVTTKGNMYQYDTILALFTSMDMSSNNLSVDIPISVTRLAGLRSFNLFKNNLTGRIPNDIDEMKVLESVDLSENQLYGMIPLSTLLQSFDPMSFQGNKLYGRPLLVNCSLDGNIPNHKHEDDESDKVEVDWFYISMAVGFALSFWGVCGSLLSWRHSYFCFLDRSWEMLLAKMLIW
ncbi:hypothetical protein H5410_000967 [Solanum commersonii]|uniref:Uncharacterized protein n=1 Tax=Solanum commersonii TaxID=4109 RepID=A0A9J6AY91_SOLCO|nr:hypothetical protein H5410_000967 [Solanum commersonii]